MDDSKFAKVCFKCSILQSSMITRSFVHGPVEIQIAASAPTAQGPLLFVEQQFTYRF